MVLDEWIRIGDDFDPSGIWLSSIAFASTGWMGFVF
jgi:hypothetical protein